MKTIWCRFVCFMRGHAWIMGIGGHDWDGIPYPCKECERCGAWEDL